jgi:hypothetical protein
MISIVSQNHKQTKQNKQRNSLRNPEPKTTQPTTNAQHKRRNSTQTNQRLAKPTNDTTNLNRHIMMTKLSSPALALVVAAASHATISANGHEHAFEMTTGNFFSCPNPGEVYQGIELGADPMGNGFGGICTPYPGRPLNTNTTSAVSASVSDDPGLNGWSCFPPGVAECPAGFLAISEMCVTFTLDAPPRMHELLHHAGIHCNQVCSKPHHIHPPQRRELAALAPPNQHTKVPCAVMGLCCAESASATTRVTARGMSPEGSAVSINLSPGCTRSGCSCPSLPIMDSFPHKLTLCPLSHSPRPL